MARQRTASLANPQLPACQLDGSAEYRGNAYAGPIVPSRAHSPVLAIDHDRSCLVIYAVRRRPAVPIDASEC